jgi:hypothetical protein
MLTADAVVTQNKIPEPSIIACGITTWYMTACTQENVASLVTCCLCLVFRSVLSADERCEQAAAIQNALWTTDS